MLDNATIDKMHNLKLIGMIKTLQQLETSQHSQLNFTEILGLLIDGESLYRSNKKQTRLLSEAKLRFKDACIEDINYQHNRGLSRETIRTVIGCQWVTKAENIILLGPTGVGKTYLACAFAKQACRFNYSVKYFRLSKLIEQIKIFRSDGSYSKFLSQLLKINVLILDDWGIETLDEISRNSLLEIIDDRYGINPTMVIAQLPIEHWHNYINNNSVADAILDRLINKSIKISMDGESLRR